MSHISFIPLKLSICSVYRPRKTDKTKGNGIRFKTDGLFLDYFLWTNTSLDTDCILSFMERDDLQKFGWVKRDVTMNPEFWYDAAMIWTSTTPSSGGTRVYGARGQGSYSGLLQTSDSSETVSVARFVKRG